MTTNNLTEQFAAMSTHAANPVYQAGVTAFESKNGKEMGAQRTIWMSGYYHARIKPLLDKPFC